MALVDNGTRLCDIVNRDPSIVTVFNRFGIKLGVGDKRISDVCGELRLDAAFFATILNVYLNEEYFPERILSTFSAATIVGYLRKTNRYYTCFQLPNIERHFNLLMQRSDHGGNLPLIRGFFNEVKAELESRIADDERQWFPEIIDMEQAVGHDSDVEMTPASYDDGHDTVEDKIDDLTNMLVRHLSGDYDLNLCNAVVLAVFTLKRDIMKNNRIRYRLLQPLSNLMSNS